jgi:hypothetical protein
MRRRFTPNTDDVSRAYVGYWNQNFEIDEIESGDGFCHWLADRDVQIAGAARESVIRLLEGYKDGIRWEPGIVPSSSLFWQTAAISGCVKLIEEMGGDD